MMVSCSIPETTAGCRPLLVTACGSSLGAAREKGLALRLPGGVESAPRLLGDPTRTRVTCGCPPRTRSQSARPGFDGAVGVEPCRRVHQISQRFTGQQLLGPPVEERGRKVTLEAARDGEIPRSWRSPRRTIRSIRRRDYLTAGYSMRGIPRPTPNDVKP
jgi:hypothetical protein